jgi:beta-lactamase superfamily II metal-dependent hydrolase
MAFQLPKKGFVFWPVATGDSTTIVVKDKQAIVQIDLHHCSESNEEDSDTTPIVDELVRLLPKKNGKPYLAVFALTHPDQDHILGFEDLLSKVTIGELWHTPRIFREYKENFCDDAKKFREEADRRRKIMIEKGNNVGSGDRLRVIGHDEGVFNDDKYKDFPKEGRSYPGGSIEVLDGENYAGTFEAFVHAPFKQGEDSSDDRNNSSLALQVMLTEGAKTGKVLIFGDREYPTIKQIFDKTKEKERENYLEWNVQLAAHHCSKKVMFWRDDSEENEKYRKDIMEDFENAGLPSAYIVASCRSDFTDAKGDNPPHSKARENYETIVDSGHFLCTHEHPNTKNPEPIVFTVGSDGFEFDDKRTKSTGPTGLAAAVSAARGSEKPPTTQVGFGAT